MTQPVPVSGWSPDMDPYLPGVVTECEMLEPTVRGMRSAPSAIAAEWPALAAACRGAALITKLDGSRRMFAGTQTKLYEAGSGAWTDRSAGAGTYTGSSESRWDFAQFGNVTLAINGVDDAQESTSGAFAALAAMPIAKHVCTTAGFVIVANINDSGLSYQHADGWWASALYDYTSWTPSIATQAVRGRLLDTPGEITALRPLGADVVAFKARSMFVGRYVGPSIIWSWSQVPGDIGAFSQSGVVSDGEALYWWGGDDFYRFDGTRPVAIGGPVRRWFQTNAAQGYLYKILGHYDRSRGLVRWYFPQIGSTTPDACIVYHPLSNRWGRADRAVEATVDAVASGITYNVPGPLAGATFDSTAYPQTYDSSSWTAAVENAAVVDSAHVVQLLTGVSTASALVSGAIGDDDTYSLLRRARVRYADGPATASMTAYTAATTGDAFTERSTVAAVDGKFDTMQSARWHKLRFDWTGDTEVIGYAADIVPQGVR